MKSFKPLQKQGKAAGHWGNQVGKERKAIEKDWGYDLGIPNKKPKKRKNKFPANKQASTFSTSYNASTKIIENQEPLAPAQKQIKYRPPQQNSMYQIVQRSPKRTIHPELLAWIAMHVAPEKFAGRSPTMENATPSAIARRTIEFVGGPTTATNAYGFYLFPTNIAFGFANVNSTNVYSMGLTGLNANTGVGTLAGAVGSPYIGVTLFDACRTLATSVEMTCTTASISTSGEVLGTIMYADGAPVGLNTAYTTTKAALVANLNQSQGFTDTAYAMTTNSKSLVWLPMDNSSSSFRLFGSSTSESNYDQYIYVLYDNGSLSTNLATIKFVITSIVEYTVSDLNKGLVDLCTPVFHSRAHDISSDILRNHRSKFCAPSAARKSVGDNMMTYVSKGFDALEEDLGKLFNPISWF